MEEKAKEIIRKIIFIICLAVFIYSIYNVADYFVEYQKLKEAYNYAQDFVQIESHNNLSDIEIPINSNVEDHDNWTDSQVEIPTEKYDPYKELKIDINVDWALLKLESEHLVGWIYIPDTNISYPLVHHPSDNQYYLNRDYTGKWANGGSIFLHKNTNLDSKNVLIYGHNMKTDIMFHRIRNYQKQEFADTHKYIYVVTESETRVYKVFSVVYADYWEDAYTHDFENENNLSFMEYINQEINESIITTDTRAIVEEDKIISLSTCSGKSRVNRLLVHAVLITTY